MNARMLPIEHAGAAVQRRMHALLEQCFHGVTFDGFRADLADKTHVLLIERDDMTLAGFSTIALYRAADPAGVEATIVCSGDTIMAPDAWSSPILPTAWLNGVHDLHESVHRNDGGLYWLLICSGFRTFRFQPVFMRTSFAGPAAPCSPALHRWMHELARQRWGAAFDDTTGVVRFAEPQRLRGGLVEIPPSRLNHPDVRRFLQLNPGHADGDELVCLTSLGFENLSRAGRRLVRARVPGARNPLQNSLPPAEPGGRERPRHTAPQHEHHSGARDRQRTPPLSRLALQAGEGGGEGTRR